MQKPLIVDLPIPSLENIGYDVKTARIISSAYAGRHGELSATLQYVYHNLNFLGQNYSNIADVMMGIALAEMDHFKILGELLYKLGVDPVYSEMPPYKYNFYNTACVNYSNSVQKMLLDDISSEMLAVKEYEKMAKLVDNDDVSAILLRIALDEQLHIKVLRETLEGYMDSTAKANTCIIID